MPVNAVRSMDGYPIHFAITNRLLPGEALKTIRRMHELSENRVAELSDLPVATIRWLEHSSEDVSDEHATKLALAYKIKPSLLLSWNQER